MASCQFFGLESVIDAYRYRELDIWGVFDGREFMAGGEGEAELRQYLSMLEKHGSAAIYRLKVYKDIEDIDDLDDKTPSAGSFKFKLTDSSFGRMAAISGPVTQIKSTSVADLVAEKMNEQIVKEVSKAIDKRFNGDTEKEEKPESLGEMVMGLIRDPEKLMGLIGTVKAVFNTAPPAAAYTMPAMVAGVQPGQPGQHIEHVVPDAETETEDEKRLNMALDTLADTDPAIVDHLEKLAKLAKKKPDMFKMLLNSLDGL